MRFGMIPTWHIRSSIQFSLSLSLCLRLCLCWSATRQNAKWCVRMQRWDDISISAAAKFFRNIFVLSLSLSSLQFVSVGDLLRLFCGKWCMVIIGLWQPARRIFSYEFSVETDCGCRMLFQTKKQFAAMCLCNLVLIQCNGFDSIEFVMQSD